MTYYKEIEARFKTTCSKCKEVSTKGSMIYWMKGSPVYCKACYEIMNETTNEASYIQAQEDAYFDNFCHNNNI
jgi:hypothetical protein